MKIFSIRDLKSEAYARPFFSQNRATAMRELSMSLQQNTMMIQYSEDFALFEIGDFDETVGTLEGIQPHHVCDIRELIQDETDAPDPSPRIA